MEKQRENGGRADPRPIIDLIIKQSDPRIYTEVYMQAFAQIYNEGLLDYGKVRPNLPPSFVLSLPCSHPPSFIPLVYSSIRS